MKLTTGEPWSSPKEPQKCSSKNKPRDNCMEENGEQFHFTPCHPIHRAAGLRTERDILSCASQAGGKGSRDIPGAFAAEDPHGCCCCRA